MNSEWYGARVNYLINGYQSGTKCSPGLCTLELKSINHVRIESYDIEWETQRGTG